MKVALSNIWTDQNKGDTAISLGTLQEIRKAFPDAQLTGISFDSERDKDFSREYHYEMDEFGVEMLGAVYPRLSDAGRARGNKYIRFARELLRGMKWQVFLWLVHLLGRNARCLLWRRSRKTFDAIADCDLMIVKGGGYISGRARAIFEMTTLFNVLHPALLARALKRKYVFLGHSMWDIHTGYSRRMMRRLVKSSALIMTREGVTYRHLREIGVEMSHVRVGVDMGFALDPVGEDRAAEIMRKEGIRAGATNIGLTVVHWPIKDPTTPRARAYQAYLRGVAGVLDRIADEFDVEFWFMPQVLEIREIHHDAVAVEKIVNLMRRKDKAHVVTADYHPKELIGLYRTMSLFLATRFHSAIFSSIAGVPVVAISYEGPKTKGIMDMLNLSDVTFYIDKLDAEALHQVVSEFLKGERGRWEGQVQLVGQLRERAHRVHELLRQIYEGKSPDEPFIAVEGG